MVENTQPTAKPETFTLTFSREEIVERIKALSKSENVETFVKAKKGEQEYDELQKLIQLVE